MVKKAALVMVAAVLALTALYIWRPEWFNSPGNNTFKTPKGDYVVRLDNDGHPTAFLPDGEARQNNVQLVVTFESGVKKTCNGDCPVEANVSKIEAKQNGKIIATWP